MPKKSKSSKKSSPKKEVEQETKKVEFTRSDIPPIFYKKIDASRLSFTDWDTENDRSKAMYIAYPRYDHPKYGNCKFIMQTPDIVLSQYGIPPIGEFTPNDSKREYMKVPFDPSKSTDMALREIMKDIDTHISKKKSKKLFEELGNPAVQYQSIVRKPQKKNDLVIGKNKDKKEEEKEKFEFMKCLFDMDYETRDPDTNVKDLSTKVFVADKAKCELDVNKFSSYSEWRKQLQFTKAPVKSITELTNIARWGSTVKLIIMANKIWLMKAAGDNDKRKYGLGFKIMQMQVIPRDSPQSVRSHFKDSAFREEGEDSDSEQDNKDEPKSIIASKEDESDVEISEGSDDEGSDNEGSDNEGSANEGSDNEGSDNEGSDNEGSDNEGSDNEGSDNEGSDNEGSYNEGSDNEGSDNEGSDEEIVVSDEEVEEVKPKKKSSSKNKKNKKKK